MTNLKQKIQESLDEGYEKEEIIEVIKEEGYTRSEIGKALAHLVD